jgi:hypothetical protein
MSKSDLLEFLKRSVSDSKRKVTYFFIVYSFFLGGWGWRFESTNLYRF